MASLHDPKGLPKEGESDSLFVSKFLEERQALPAQSISANTVALEVGEYYSSIECLRSPHGHDSLASRQCPLQEGPPLVQVTTSLPEPSQRIPQSPRHLQSGSSLSLL